MAIASAMPSPTELRQSTVQAPAGKSNARAGSKWVSPVDDDPGDGREHADPEHDHEAAGDLDSPVGEHRHQHHDHDGGHLFPENVHVSERARTGASSRRVRRGMEQK